MFNKALLVFNSQAGQAQTSKQVAAATSILAASLPELQLMQIQEQGGGERICRERGEGLDLLIIMGGDGTVHECVNGLKDLEAPPVVAIIPTGTCNDFSRSLGMPQTVEGAARAILDGRTHAVDIGMVNDRLFTNFFGLGLITEASENVHARLKNMFGRLSYLIRTLQTIGSTSPFSYKLSWSEGELEGEAVMIYVSNGRYLGTRQLPFADDCLHDGKFDVLILQQAGLSLLRELLASRSASNRNWKPSSDTFSYIQCDQLTLTTSLPMEGDTDGEIYTTTPAELALNRHKLTFIVGDSYS